MRSRVVYWVADIIRVSAGGIAMTDRDHFKSTSYTGARTAYAKDSLGRYPTRELPQVGDHTPEEFFK